MKPIGDLKDIHKGYDIYVVASGASAGYIEPSFFDNKFVIGVNQVWKRFNNLDYVVSKDANSLVLTLGAAKLMGIKSIVSKHDCGTLTLSHNSGADYYFEHLDNEREKIDLSVVGTDKIVVSYSTITSAIHIAAYMGAANIIIVGHDCGKLDGKLNMPGYPESPMGAKFYSDFVGQIEPSTIQLRARIKEVYGCNLYSLNPFVNFGIEGHKYEK